MIKNRTLLETGFVLTQFPLEAKVLELLQEELWNDLDHYFLEISRPGGVLRNFLLEFLDFHLLEHIIAIRKAPLDEEGIWHDDGSRHLGFSLSLNRKCDQISGGELAFKKKEGPTGHIFSAQPYGTIILFLSGLYGYEHRVSAVTKGERIVIAGWCS
jgi:hypothetical protein